MRITERAIVFYCLLIQAAEYHNEFVICPHCGKQIPDTFAISAVASMHAKKAKTGGKRPGAGRPKKIVRPEPEKK